MIRKIKTSCRRISEENKSTLPIILQFTQQSLSDNYTTDSANIGTIGSGNFSYSLEFYREFDNNDTEMQDFKMLHDTISSATKISSILRSTLFANYYIYQLDINYAQNTLSINQYDFYLNLFTDNGLLIKRKNYCIMRSYLDKKIYVIFTKNFLNTKYGENNIPPNFASLITPVLFYEGFNKEDYSSGAELKITTDYNETNRNNNVFKFKKIVDLDNDDNIDENITNNKTTFFSTSIKNYNDLNDQNLLDFSVYIKSGNQMIKLYRDSYIMTIIQNNPDEYISEQSNPKRDYFKMLMKEKYTNKIHLEDPLEISVGLILYTELDENDTLYLVRNNNENKDKNIRKSNYNILYFNEAGEKIPFPTENPSDYPSEFDSVIKESLDLPTYGFKFSILDDDNRQKKFNFNKELKNNKIFDYKQKIDSFLLFAKKENEKNFIRVDDSRSENLSIENNIIKFEEFEAGEYEIIIYCSGEKLSSIPTEESVGITLQEMTFNNRFYSNYDNYNNKNILNDGNVPIFDGEQKYFYMFDSNDDDFESDLLYSGELYVENQVLKVKSNGSDEYKNITWVNNSTAINNLLEAEKQSITEFFNNCLKNVKQHVENKMKETKVKYLNLALKRYNEAWITLESSQTKIEKPINSDCVVFELSDNSPFTINFYNENNVLVRTEYECVPQEIDSKYYYCDFFMSNNNENYLIFTGQNVLSYNNLILTN